MYFGYKNVKINCRFAAKLQKDDKIVGINKAIDYSINSYSMNFFKLLKNYGSKYKTIDSFLILIILIVGILLRFYKYSEIPFTNDEISALYRARFDTFHELITQGVLIDGHPAGVQVFLYYWVKLFGDAEFVVKLPFMVAGVMSIYLTYKIAKFWFNPTVGLIAASFLSCLQYTVMYSQIERPYGSGIFIGLALVWFWTLFFWGDEKKRVYNWMGFVIFGALSAYNHHFNLLLLGLVGITGLFFIQKKNIVLYVLSGVAIFVLYIPHIQIFFYQLNVGGVGGTEGWLGAPGYDFLYNYLKFAFHFSRILYLLTFVLIITGFVLFIKDKEYLNRKANAFRIIALSWFFLSLLIGFYYSRLVAPVLQYSVLLFVFPFLLIGLFSFYSDINKYFKTIIVVAILGITCYSLISERKYYAIFYHQGYKECVSQIIKIQEENTDSPAVLFNGFEPFFMNYYEKLFHKKIACINFNIDTMNAFQFRKLVQNQNNDHLLLAYAIPTPPYFQDIIRETFPFLVKESVGFGYELYLFSKISPKQIINPVFVSCNNFEEKSLYWQMDTNFIIKDTLSGNKVYHFQSDQEWGPLFEVQLKDILSNKFNNIHISLKTRTINKAVNPILVIAILDKNKKCVSWHTSDFKNFINNTHQFENVYLSLRMADVHLKNLDFTANIYVWNKNKDDFEIDDFTVRIEKGNHLIYAVISDF